MNPGALTTFPSLGALRKENETFSQSTRVAGPGLVIRSTGPGVNDFTLSILTYVPCQDVILGQNLLVRPASSNLATCGINRVVNFVGNKCLSPDELGMTDIWRFNHNSVALIV
ncbi:hypothetical protein RRG08_001753 [Elysia crispata]|uniref:Uncharacterized protein n=1 Tax=Elysia crispata TaxID=231223 RepID=A0AAE1ALH6_9GAST|nr:hypothetical protein RRG08_001753 [Elysia crispata]